MATYDDQIAALETALASGSLSVDFSDGTKITYRSIPHLRDAIDYFRDRQSVAVGRKGVSVSVGAYSKG